MKNLLLVFISFLLLNACDSSQPKSIVALAERVQSGLSQYFIFELKNDSIEKFEIESHGEKIVISGSTLNSITAGLGWYLKYFCNSGTYWTVARNKIAVPLPKVAQKISKKTSMRHRYYMNYCVDKYNYRFWDWKRWKQEIDWMALNGVNIGLVVIDRGAVMQKLVESYGIHDTINRYYGDGIMPPAQFYYQLHEYEMIQLDQRIRLQQTVINRMRELGIQPLLDGFKGIVPKQLTEIVKNVKFNDGGTWVGNPKEPVIDVSDPFFEEFGTKYYQQQKKFYGDQLFIDADPVVEGSDPKNTDLSEMGLKVQNLILKTYPKATWVLQGWEGVPRDDLLRKTDPEHTLILDLACEIQPEWRKRSFYSSYPWVWSIVNNFGGNTGMYGNLDNIFDQQDEVKSKPQGKFLCGVGALMEGIENNPLVYNALFESAWKDTKPDMNQWIYDYAKGRYGKPNEHARRAWDILYKKIYSASRWQKGPTQNIMCARPKFKIDRVSSWSTAIPYFTNEDIGSAWDEMMLAAEELGDSDGFQLDLVDLTRQIISNYAWDIYPRVIAAHKTANIKEFDYWSGQFLDLFDNMNTLLSSRKEFMVGPWIEMHRNWGTDDKQKAYFERVAKTFITILGDKPFSEEGMRDYSHREWAGTMSDLYKARFVKYFDELRKCLDKNAEPLIDWYDFDYAWTITPHQYEVTPSCSAVDVCKTVYEKYRNKIIEVE